MMMSVRPRLRDSEGFAAPGYAGRKRADVIIKRTVLQHVGSSLWIGSWLREGGGGARDTFPRAIEAVVRTCEFADFASALSAERVISSWRMFGGVVFKFLRDRKRKGLLKSPFPDEWVDILDEHLPFVADLEGAELDRFLDHTQVFALQKHWIAAGGLDEVSTLMKVVISGCAARLVRNLPLDAYDRLTEIVVYPRSFALEDDAREILGLAHPWGTVVLAWDAVRCGIATTTDGHDTAVHEFAHALDVEDGVYDGTPLLESGAHYRDWVQVLGDHFARLKEDPHGHVLRPYGATNEAEFFAVATEAFFEKSKTLRRKAPDLYEQLSRFYELDPAAD